MSDDFSRTLQEVMTGYQGMSSTIGHFGGPSPVPFASAGYGQPIGPGGIVVPNPPPMVPVVAPPMPMPPPMAPPFVAPIPPPQYYAPPMVPPMAPQLGGWSSGMAAAQQYQMNPMFASYMDPTMNFPGAGMMTDARTGVFRQHAVADFRTPRPMGLGGGVSPPDAILPITALQRTTPFLQFSRPYDAALYEGSEAARLLQQGHIGYAQAAANNMVSAAGSTIVGGGMAALGGFFRGAQGAMTMGTIGSVAGLALPYIPGVNQAVAAAFDPAIQRRAQAIQTQYGSRSFMVGAGSDTDISGSGLSSRAAQQLTYTFDTMAAETRGATTRQDFINMMQAGGEQGLLDFAQNADQIADTVKRMSKVLGTFAQITGDPDFQNNIKKMGQLRRLGLGMDQMDTAMRNLDQYARMAGMDVDQILQRGGMQGGAIFQGAGLSAAQGLMTGGMATAQGRQLVASGAFTEEQLSLYGGESGIGQKLTEVNAAFLNSVAQPLLPYLVKEGPNGKVTLDAARAEALRKGTISYQDALRQGSENVSRMSDAGRSDLFSEFRRRELTADLGRTLGAEGVQQAAMQQILSVSRENPGISPMMAAEMALGADGAAIISRMGNKTFQTNMLAQMQKEKERLEFEAATNRTTPGVDIGLMARLGFDFGDPLGAIQDKAASWMEEHEEGKRRAAVGITRYTQENTGSGFRMGRMRGGPVSGGRLSRGDRLENFARDLFEPYLDSERALVNEFLGNSNYMDVQNRWSVSQGVSDMDVLSRQYGSEEKYSDQNIARGRQMLDATRAARRLDDAGAADNAVGATIKLKELGGDYNKGVRSLASLMKKSVGYGITDATPITNQQTARALGISEAQLASLSPEEVGAAFRDASIVAGDDGTTYMDEIGKRAETAYGERIGKKFMAGAGGTGALNDALRTLGFSNYEKLSAADKALAEKLGNADEDDAIYLILAALKAKGKSAFTGGMARNYASHITKELQERDGAEFGNKLKAAQKVFAGMPEDQQDALIVKIKGMVETEGKDRFGHTVKKVASVSEIMGRVKKLGESGADLRTANVLNKMKTELDKQDGAKVGSFDDVESLVSQIQNATSEEKATFRAAGYGDIVNLVSKEGFSLDNNEDWQQLAGKLEKIDAGSVDISSTAGTQSEAVTAQTQAIVEQIAMFDALNAAMGSNTESLDSNTAAIKRLTQAMGGNGAEAEKDRMVGDVP